MRDRCVVTLEGSGLDTRTGGGKAAAIDRLIAAGFKVPPSFVITAEAYRRFVAQDELQGLLSELPSATEVDDPEVEAERIAKAFMGAPLPEELHDAIMRAAEAITRSGGASGEVAVRSSATVEDAAAASYAGQFATELGCKPGEELFDAIRRVWASAWSPAVRAYREQVGAGDDEEIAMGVLVMDMVDAEHAGVVFTRDPEQRQHIRVELVEGLGEKLVSGSETPERIVLSRDEPDAGLDDRLPAFVAEVARTALAVEEALGGAPQDIEWAHDGDHLWILQSRPITVCAAPDGGKGDAVSDDSDIGGALDEPAAVPDDGFDSRTDTHAHTPAGITEMMPGVLPPLVWTMMATPLEEAFRALFAALGGLPVEELAEGHRFVGRFRGRAALDLDLLRAAARNMPGQSEAELERQYFGEVLSPDLVEREEERQGGVSGKGKRSDRAGGLRSLMPVMRAVRMRAAERREASIVTEATDLLVSSRPDLDGLSADELRRYHDRVLDLAARAFAVEVAVAGLAVAAYGALERYLGEVLEQPAAGELAQRLTAGAIPVCKTTALELCELVDRAGESPELARALGRGDDVFEAVGRVSSGKRFLAEFAEVIEQAGSARVFGGERWVDRPGAAVSALRQALRRTRRESPDPARHLRELEARLTSTWRWRLGRLITGQIIDVRLMLLRRMVADATELLRLREETKRTVLRLGGEVRRIAEHVATGLVSGGHLDEIADIELLSHTELIAVLAGEPPPDADELRRRRSVQEEMASLGSLPARFEGRPGGAKSSADPSADVLQGWAAGPGSHTGKPVVVTSPAGADLQEGDVLVAESTDPSWTPLFVTAGAVVVEEGGPLSHAAIVAREFGLPAVLNVPGAVERLRDVAGVIVDGTAGTVKIVEDPA